MAGHLGISEHLETLGCIGRRVFVPAEDRTWRESPAQMLEESGFVPVPDVGSRRFRAWKEMVGVWPFKNGGCPNYG